MYFLKLVRPINLVIIALTMYGIRFYIKEVNYFQKINDNWIDFLLLVFSTILIAAAGNIINDYFDVKADRINKPEKLIITKHLKRRWAIVTHWTFNGLAFCIAIFLSFKYQTLWFVFIHLLTINLLWFYSLYFKKKILTGNVIIALLTGLVPILVLIYFQVGNSYHLSYSEFDSKTWLPTINFDVIYLFAFFAIVQNLAREIVKDAQDIEGDKHIYVKSLPMVIGQRNALYLVSFLLFSLPLFYLIYFLMNLDDSGGFLNLSLKTLPFLSASLINISTISLIFYRKIQNLKLIDNLIKISMFLGVLAIFYLAFYRL